MKKEQPIQEACFQRAAVNLGWLCLGGTVAFAFEWTNDTSGEVDDEHRFIQGLPRLVPIVFRRVCGVDENVTTKWRSVQLLQQFAAHHPSDAFNSFMTALFFKALPDKTVTFKGDPCIGAKKCTHRMQLVFRFGRAGTAFSDIHCAYLHRKYDLLTSE